MPPPTILRVRHAADVEAVLDPRIVTPVLLFKHSTRCGLSDRAHAHFLRYAVRASARGIRLAEVRVVEERPLSQALAERTGVAHASPQALLLRSGQVLWHARHTGITEAALQAAERHVTP